MNNRYNNWSDYTKKVFGKKLVRLSINAGFTCPNRDGTVGVGGCIFCGDGASEFNSDSSINITEQLNLEKKKANDKWGDVIFCAYFQSFTNTYGEISYLKKVYDEPLKFDGVKAIAIATRPDCLDDEVLDLLDTINKNTFLWVELGLQTIHDKTANFINRCYDLKVYDEAVKNLNERNIRYMTHLIFGLPYETNDMILESVRYVVNAKPFGVKFHSLFIERNTRLSDIYNNEKFKLLTLEEYANLVVDAISITPKETIIARITGDGDKSKIIEPIWACDKLKVISKINFLMKTRDIIQGVNYKCE